MEGLLEHHPVDPTEEQPSLRRSEAQPTKASGTAIGDISLRTDSWKNHDAAADHDTSGAIANTINRLYRR